MISAEKMQSMDKTLAYIGLNIDEATKHNFKDVVNIAKETLSAKVKTLKTYEDFVEFVHHMQFFNLEFMGKRKKQKMYSFSHAYEDDSITNPKTDDGLDQVHYVYKDDESTGLSHVKNLYRVLDVIEGDMAV